MLLTYFDVQKSVLYVECVSFDKDLQTFAHHCNHIIYICYVKAFYLYCKPAALKRGINIIIQRYLND